MAPDLELLYLKWCCDVRVTLGILEILMIDPV